MKSFAEEKEKEIKNLVIWKNKRERNIRKMNFRWKNKKWNAWLKDIME